MLSVIVPVRGRVERFRLMLTSLLFRVSENAPETQVIVVNDGAVPEVEQAAHAIRDKFAELDVSILSISHGGRSAARNAGAVRAKAERLLFLDSDVLVGESVLSDHHAVLRNPDFLVRGTILNLPWLAAFEDPITGTYTDRAIESLRIIVGSSDCRLRSRTLQLDHRGCPLLPSPSVTSFTKFERDIHSWLATLPANAPGRWIGCTGAQLSMSKQLFVELGGFDERMGLAWGAEDLEFGYRAERHGACLLHAAESIIWHMNHDVSGRQGHHEQALRYFSRKHSDPSILRLLDYFAGKCCLEEVFAYAQLS